MQQNFKNITKNKKKITKTTRRKDDFDLNFPISSFGARRQ